MPDPVPHPRAYDDFIRLVMSDVYALLEFLSGRAWPSMVPASRNGHPPAQTPPPDWDKHAAIEADLKDWNALYSRVMRIAIDLESGPICAVDSAFLLRALDQLNTQAAPASGGSISYTTRVVVRLLSKNSRSQSKNPSWIAPNEALDMSAFKLADFVTRQIKLFWCVLIATIIVSTYVALVKLMLDTQDAVNRDFGANRASIVASMAPPTGSAAAGVALRYARTAAAGAPENVPIQPVEGQQDFLDEYCISTRDNLAQEQRCFDHKVIVDRRSNIHRLINHAIWPFHQLSDLYLEQSAATLAGVLGNSVLPTLYALVGSLGAVLRRLNRELSDYLLTPRVLRASCIRVMLGVMTGVCIGLFVNSSAGAATLSGLGGAAVTLSASGIAFLAGYGVDGVFRMLDALLAHVFRANEGRKPSA